MSTSPNKPSIKQQRAASREAKLVEYRRQQARAARNRKLAIGGGVLGGVAVVALIATTVILTPKPVTYATNSGKTVQGVATFTNDAAHTTATVNYEQTPPAGGPHDPVWLNCGVYTETQRSENAVHAQEHGAVWVTYDPALPEADIAAIRAKLPSTYVIMSPFPGLENPVTLSAWNAQLSLDKIDDPRFEEFFEAYWKSNAVPEPGSPCTGGITGPGAA
ncbi:DUF3105 domain-containing protein [Mycetocola spongiae]|uniref:DUF3105 domain-containing protein n=1 Tax=Mycetocola spongiae TaxID=2859226 RepID=UPI001CF3D2C6|nr:DUF3105 domain-containing protein [Mycetocola spongiae]UCR87898.1 DUF3105 domain-containing protein [Mycetocola spongiae]